MKAGVFIQEISLDLNDQEPGYEYLTWPREQLRSYIAEILTQLARQFKSLFLDSVIVEVKPGGLWQKACGCEQVLRIVGEVTEDGEELVRELVKMSDDSRLSWNGNVQTCPAGTYVMRGYALSKVDDSLFKIIPPIPRGEKDRRYVLIECFRGPSDFTDDFDIPQRLVAMVKQWALFRAYAVDSENNPVVAQISENHRQAFNSLYQMELAEIQREEAKYDRLRTVQDSPPDNISQRV